MPPVRKIQGQASCEQHGPYGFTAFQKGARVLGKTCPVCLQDIQLRLLDLGQAKASRARDALWAQRLHQARIPAAFLQSSFDNYQVAKCEVARNNTLVIEQYADNFADVLATTPATGMVLLGFPGTGKTHLACALIRHLIASGHTARYISIPTMLYELKEGGRGHHENGTSAQLRELSDVQLLVMDEYGAHTRTELDYQLLFQVVNARYERNLPTALVSNVQMASLTAELDQRFLERVMGFKCSTLAFAWGSYRAGHLPVDNYNSSIK